MIDQIKYAFGKTTDAFGKTTVFPIHHDIESKQENMRGVITVLV